MCGKKSLRAMSNVLKNAVATPPPMSHCINPSRFSDDFKRVIYYLAKSSYLYDWLIFLSEKKLKYRYLLRIENYVG
jgi:hypothetical protein